MKFVKSSAQNKAVQTLEQPLERPVNQPVRWSDIAANRRTTHPLAAPISKVLHIVEIVENFLKYLPEEDLLFNVQAACKAFRGVISTSPTLQKLLWKVPQGSPNTWTLDHNGRTPVPVSAAHEILAAAGTNRRRFCTIHVLNPLLLKVYDYSNKPSDMDWRLYYYLEHNHLNQATLANKIRAHLAQIPESSCRSMQIARPPIKEVIVQIQGKREHNPWEDRRGLPKWFYGTTGKHRIRDEDGVTFGQLIDVIIPNTRGYHDSLENIVFVDGLPVTIEEKAAFDLNRARKKASEEKELVHGMSAVNIEDSAIKEG